MFYRFRFQVSQMRLKWRATVQFHKIPYPICYNVTYFWTMRRCRHHLANSYACSRLPAPAVWRTSLRPKPIQLRLFQLLTCEWQFPLPRRATRLPLTLFQRQPLCSWWVQRVLSSTKSSFSSASQGKVAVVGPVRRQPRLTGSQDGSANTQRQLQYPREHAMKSASPA